MPLVQNNPISSSSLLHSIIDRSAANWQERHVSIIYNAIAHTGSAAGAGYIYMSMPFIPVVNTLALSVLGGTMLWTLANGLYDLIMQKPVRRELLNFQQCVDALTESLEQITAHKNLCKSMQQHKFI